MIKKITQTAVINIAFQRIFIKLDVSYASQHTRSRSRLENNVYHRCLCYFLNQATMA